MLRLCTISRQTEEAGQLQLRERADWIGSKNPMIDIS